MPMFTTKDVGHPNKVFRPLTDDESNTLAVGGNTAVQLAEKLVAEAFAAGAQIQGG